MMDKESLLILRGRLLVEKVDAFCKTAVSSAKAMGISVDDAVPSETIPDLATYLNYMLDSGREAVVSVAGMWCRFRFSITDKSTYIASIDDPDGDGLEVTILTVKERLPNFETDDYLDYAVAA